MKKLFVQFYLLLFVSFSGNDHAGPVWSIILPLSAPDDSRWTI